jgi:hypothetical protein
MAEIIAFADRQEAIDKGFEEGTADRKNGYSPNQEVDARELREGGGAFKWKRGPGSRFYEDWRLAYEAGFRGDPKPP